MSLRLCRNRPGGRSQVNPLKRLFVASSVVLMTTAVFAGPAVAAKGGNKAVVEQCKKSDNAGFRNLGQCVSSSAKGAPQPQPQLDLEITTYAGTNPSQC